MTAQVPSSSPSAQGAPAGQAEAGAAATNGADAAADAQVDVLVIGGGPAGTTAATFLARQGWKVVLLEKDAHPRFHIGESLLPMNLPILQRLGVLDRVAAIGVHKPGADFPMRGDRDSINVFRFDRALDPQFGHAYQVRRSEFDQLLFDNALASGVDARQQVKVERVEFGADGRPERVHARDADGEALAFRPRYLVDASGRDTFLGSRLKLKKKNPAHQSAAIFSHFRGVTRRPGEEAGNITVERFAHGWMWLIPLREDVMSVGAVCFPEYLKTRQGDNESFLMDTLRATPSVWSRMADAERIAPVHATGNYSYTCTRMHGPGWVMAGDAFAFIDPVFSSGVYLGMNGGEQAAKTVDAILRDPAREAAEQKAMDRRLRRGLRYFSWFIYRFTTPVMEALFAEPRNHLQLEQAVISMLAGDVFDNKAVRWRLRVFRVVYALTAMRMAPQALAGWWRRRRQVGERFSGDTLQGGNP
ncbi:hydroxylase [Pseudoxanthomonas jiangsuensis]|uniref:NAD(P)/FAD-dependent oxidoreductase n=1 Tax=Pseudoxanthomonas jiangsuensis TaxID=619688 RepID=UPI00139136DA|nr:NAD(P)/FAD-dependent oxidoreductase [Pseudoxanthomonas jiangsuensis]KAF1691894.1 hydroxylase [Pseudoxanthomonas jiangsuensis]